MPNNVEPYGPILVNHSSCVLVSKPLGVVVPVPFYRRPRILFNLHQAIFDSVSDTILVIDPVDFTIISANRAALDQVKMEEGEVIGKTCHGVTHHLASPCGPQDDVCPIHEMMETGRSVIVEHTHYDRDGTPFWVEVSASPVRNAEGKIVQVVHVARDITERRRAEEALRESERMYKNLFELAPDAIATANMKGVITSINPAASKLAGYSEEEIVGRHFSKLAVLRARDVPRYLEMFSAHLRGKKPEPFELQYRRNNGSYGWARVHVSLLEAGGKKLGIQAILHDITKQKEAYDALRESEVKYRELFDDIGDGVIQTDLDGNYLEVNQAAAEIFGYESPGEMLHGRVKTWETFPSREEWELLQEKLMRERVVEKSLNRFKRKEGSIGWVEATSRVRRNEGGEVVGFEGILRDVTDRVRYQERLKSIHRHAVVLASAETVEEVACLTVGVVAEVLGFDLGSFLVVDNDVLRQVYTGGREIEVSLELPLDGRGITVRAVRTGESQLVPDTRQDDDYHPGFSEGVFEIWSELAVPVKTGDEVIAVLNVESATLDAFTGEDRRLLEIFAEYVASTMSRLEQEKGLRASEERYRTLLEDSMDAIFVNDATKYLYANKPGAELLGFEDPSELVGREFIDFFNHEQRESITRRTQERLRGETHPTRFDVRMRRRDGKQVFGEVNINVIEYEGKPAILSMIRDVTERREREMELRKMSQAIEQSASSVIITDIEGNIEYVNTRFTELTGYSYEEAVGKNPRILKSGEMPPDEYRRLWETIEAGGEWRGGFHNRKKNGEFHWVRASISPVMNEDGVITHFLGVQEDITEQKKMEDLIHYQASLVENISEAIISTDLEFNIVSWNDGAERIYGWREEEVVGKPVVDITGLDYPNHEQEEVEAEFLEKGSWKGEVLQRRKDGRAIDILTSVSLIRDSGGTPMGAVAVNRDITERRRMEAELRRANWAVGERVKELTCLYGISELVERPGVTLEGILEGTVRLISPAWQHPDVTCARITLKGQTYETDGFRETEWGQSSDIKVWGERAGVVEVFYLEDRPMFDEGPFLKEERDLIEAIAERLGRIAERVYNEEEIHRMVSELSTLNEASTNLIMEKSIEETLEAILDYSLRLTGSEFGYVGTLDDEGNLVSHFEGEVWEECRIPDKTTVFKDFKGLRGHGLISGEVVLSNFPSTDPRSVGVPDGHVPIECYLGVPIMYRDELVGQIGVANKPGGYSGDDQRLLETLANTASAVIYRHGQMEEIKDRNSLLEALYDVSLSLTSEVETESMAKVTLKACKEQTGAAAGYVALHDEETDSNNVLVLDTGGLPCTLDPSLPMPVRGLRAEAYRSRRGVIENDFQSSPHVRYLPGGHVGLGSVLFVPMILEDKVMGLLGLANKPGGFSEEDLRICRPFANHLAVSIRNAQMSEEMTGILRSLNDQNERLRRLDEMKSRFVSTATHELRTPLVSIKGYTDFILSGNVGEVPERLGEMLGVVKRNADRLAKITDDLLDVQRIESGRLQISPEPINLREVVEEAEDEVRPLVSQKGQLLEVHIDEGLPSVTADRVRMSQVLVNLLGNAVKFTPEGGRIKLRALDEDGNLKVEISDTGIGIGEKDLLKLFKPFPDIERPVITEPSTGLGLSICKGIVELHGGKIWAESEGLGKGSTFTFTLPRDKGAS